MYTLNSDAEMTAMPMAMWMTESQKPGDLAGSGSGMFGRSQSWQHQFLQGLEASEAAGWSCLRTKQQQHSVGVHQARSWSAKNQMVRMPNGTAKSSSMLLKPGLGLVQCLTRPFQQM